MSEPAAALPAAPRALAVPSDRLAFVVLRVLGTVLDYAKGFLLPVLVYQQSGGSTVAAGTAYFVEFLPRAVLIPFFGSLVDRSTGKRLAYAVEAARFLLVAVWALIAYHASAWMLSSLVSLCSGLDLLFYEATATQRLGKEDLHNYQAVTQLFEPFARLVGPAAVGLLLIILPVERIVAVLAAGYCGFRRKPAGDSDLMSATVPI